MDLQGFADLHLHAGPALMEREFGAEEAARAAAEAGCRAIVLKDHHIPTMSLARTLDQRYSPQGLRIFGGTVLNNSVGGLNPSAAEAAIGFGAREIWFPTLSAQNHQESLKREGVFFPPVAGAGKAAQEYLTWIDEKGRLSRPAQEVMEVMAGSGDVILATGHGSAREADLLIRRAAELGLERILVNHPLYMVGAGEEEMRSWTSLGAYLEFTAIATLPGTPLFSLPAARVAEVVKLLGPERIVLTSDLGLKGCGLQIPGMIRFLELLREEGVGEPALARMTRDNPAALLGL